MLPIHAFTSLVQREKCAPYRAAWNEALRNRDTSALTTLASKFCQLVVQLPDVIRAWQWSRALALTPLSLQELRMRTAVLPAELSGFDYSFVEEIARWSGCLVLDLPEGAITTLPNEILVLIMADLDVRTLAAIACARNAYSSVIYTVLEMRRRSRGYELVQVTRPLVLERILSYDMNLPRYYAEITRFPRSLIREVAAVPIHIIGFHDGDVIVITGEHHLAVISYDRQPTYAGLTWKKIAGTHTYIAYALLPVLDGAILGADNIYLVGIDGHAYYVGYSIVCHMHGPATIVRCLRLVDIVLYLDDMGHSYVCADEDFSLLPTMLPSLVDAVLCTQGNILALLRPNGRLYIAYNHNNCAVSELVYKRLDYRLIGHDVVKVVATYKNVLWLDKNGMLREYNCATSSISIITMNDGIRDISSDYIVTTSNRVYSYNCHMSLVNLGLDLPSRYTVADYTV